MNAWIIKQLVRFSSFLATCCCTAKTLGSGPTRSFFKKVLSFRSTGRGLQAWQHPRELSPGVTQQLTEEERKSLAMGFRVAGHGHTSDLLSDSLCPCAAFGEVALL